MATFPVPDWIGDTGEANVEAHLCGRGARTLRSIGSFGPADVEATWRWTNGFSWFQHTWLVQVKTSITSDPAVPSDVELSALRRLASHRMLLHGGVVRPIYARVWLRWQFDQWLCWIDYYDIWTGQLILQFP